MGKVIVGIFVLSGIATIMAVCWDIGGAWRIISIVLFASLGVLIGRVIVTLLEWLLNW